MNQLPSLLKVLNATRNTIFRFPLETITAIIGTVFAIVLVEKEYAEPKDFYIKAIMSASLCLVLFLSISLFFLATKRNIILRFLSSFILGGLVICFVFNFEKDIKDTEFLQFAVLNIALHLLVSFAAFLTKTYNQDEFWEFNKQLFLRILTAALYSGVLYCGLSLAVLAIEQLFKVSIYNNIYAHTFFIIAGVFNTIFFLAGVPETNNQEAPLVLNYPKGLKNFTQYVLLPLISLYLLILICYETKILLTLSLPVGWVSNLVLVFAIFGILSFLLVHPIATETRNLWIHTFNRWFYYLLIPLLGLLFWAILYRIHLYGFTHERYYVLILAVWLTIVVAYFLTQSQPKIKFIPITLCIIALLSLVGPQSAKTISKNSQLSRFETYFNLAKKQKLTFEQEQDLSSIVDFLEENYGAKVLLSSTDNKLNTLLKKDKNPGSAKIMKALGFQYYTQYSRKEKENGTFYYYLYPNESQIVENIQGYDISFQIWNNSHLDCEQCIQINNTTYSIASTEKDYGLDLRINQDTIPLDINQFINKNHLLFNQNRNTDDKITQKIESPKYTILISYLSVSGKKEKGRTSLTSYQIRVMVKVKN
jgi:hypothetical protein